MAAICPGGWVGLVKFDTEIINNSSRDIENYIENCHTYILFYNIPETA